jgi:hypothetical protein
MSHFALASCLSMIFSENREPLFRLMLRPQDFHGSVALAPCEGAILCTGSVRSTSVRRAFMGDCMERSDDGVPSLAETRPFGAKS